VKNREDKNAERADLERLMSSGPPVKRSQRREKERMARVQADKSPDPCLALHKRPLMGSAELEAITDKLGSRMESDGNDMGEIEAAFEGLLLASVNYGQKDNAMDEPIWTKSTTVPSNLTQLV